MPKIRLWAMLIGVVVVGIALVALIKTGLPTSPSSSPSSQVSPTLPSEKTMPPPATQKSPSKPKTPTLSVKFVMPQENTEWVIGQNNTIEWNREVGYPGGGLYLLDASTKIVVGWISPNLGPSQRSFTWDTRNVLLSRSSALKKEIYFGRYVLGIIFDAKKTEIESPAFSIIRPDQVKRATHTVTIKNFAFTPNAITVAKGDKIVFVNEDSASHRILSSNFSSDVLAQGQSYTLDSSVLEPSLYNYYCGIHPSMAGSLIVK